MAKELDSKKMWESILNPKYHSEVMDALRPHIKDALKDQGFELKHGKIMSIEDKQEPFKIEAGKWYVCLKSDNLCAFPVGEVIQAISDYHFTKGGFEWKSIPSMIAREYFRPATEEEVAASGQEPKFKVGDWIVTNKNHIWYVDETPETTSYLYRLINQYGKVEVAEFEVVDEKAKLWTIEDAKDGDVLVTNSNIIFIFKYLDEGGTIAFRASCTKNSGVYFSKLKEQLCDQDVYPATKEQRGLLFQKIKEAGCEWDAGKKELKKIKEQEWEPQPGDKFRKKGTCSPLYYLCSKREDGIHFGFVQEMENGAAGGEISIFALKTEYELVERLKPFEELIEEEFNKAFNCSAIIDSNGQKLI